MRHSYVYIMTNKYRTTFYIGITSNLKKRIVEHYEGVGSKFTAKYQLTDLVYFELHTDINQAIAREKQLKNWHHDWKMNLIKEQNPTLETIDYKNFYNNSMSWDASNLNSGIYLVNFISQDKSLTKKITLVK